MNCRELASRAKSAMSSSLPNSRIRATSSPGFSVPCAWSPGRRSRWLPPREGRTSSPLNLPSPFLSTLARASSAFSISSVEISPSPFASRATTTGNACINPPEPRSPPGRVRPPLPALPPPSSPRGCANSILPSPHEMPTSKSPSRFIAMVLMVIGFPLGCVPKRIGSISACVPSGLASSSAAWPSAVPRPSAASHT